MRDQRQQREPCSECERASTTPARRNEANAANPLGYVGRHLSVGGLG